MSIHNAKVLLMPEVDSSKVRLLIRNPPFCRLTTSRLLTLFRRYLPLYQTALPQLLPYYGILYRCHPTM